MLDDVVGELGGAAIDIEPPRAVLPLVPVVWLEGEESPVENPEKPNLVGLTRWAPEEEPVRGPPRDKSPFDTQLDGAGRALQPARRTQGEELPPEVPDHALLDRVHNLYLNPRARTVACASGTPAA